MATRAAVRATPPETLDWRGVALVSWSGLTFASTDDGDPVELCAYADRSVQVTGTFGAGGSVRIEGSMDGSTYHVLTDPQGNALDITTAKVETITEVCRFIRPRVTAGDGTTDLAVRILFRGGP